MVPRRVRVVGLDPAMIGRHERRTARKAPTRDETITDWTLGVQQAAREDWDEQHVESSTASTLHSTTQSTESEAPERFVLRSIPT